jgi:hypothetical protein
MHACGVRRRGAVAEPQTPEYVRLAFLVDGRFAATAAVLAELHAQGAVDAGRARTVKLAEGSRVSPTGFERIVWNALHGSTSPGALAALPSVMGAFTALRRRLVSEGLLRRGVPSRWFLPARTRAGRRVLAEARVRVPVSADGAEVGMQVALYGNEALNALMPKFAKAAGLLARASGDVSDAADSHLPENPGFWGTGGP